MQALWEQVGAAFDVTAEGRRSGSSLAWFEEPGDSEVVVWDPSSDGPWARGLPAHQDGTGSVASCATAPAVSGCRPVTLNSGKASLMRVVHYINQFFAGVGGEEAAAVGPSVREGTVGPGRLLERLLGDDAELVATVICGDTYFGERPEDATAQVLEFIIGEGADLVIAGPAFNAGRYGLACGSVVAECERRGVAAVTGMFPENPGLVSVDRKFLYAVPTAATGTGMKDALERMVRLGVKRARREAMGLPEQDGYMPRGLQRNVPSAHTAAERAVEGLLQKINGGAFTTEIPLAVYDRVSPATLGTSLADMEIALVTEASVVPIGNPDRLESARGTRWLRYPIDGVNDLLPDEYMTVHGGFDTADVNADPDRVLPVDAMRQLVADGAVGKIHDHYYVTTGMATAIKDAERIGRQIADDLLRRKIHAVLVTST